MVRISSTVLTVLVGLTSLSRATAVDDVVRYADELREDVFPPVKTAVEDLPGSSSELQVCHVVAIQAGFVNVALQNEKIGEAVMASRFRARVFSDCEFTFAGLWIETRPISTSYKGKESFANSKLAHHVLMELINGIVSKNSSFIEDKACWPRCCDQDSEEIPEILKEHVQALNNDGDQQLAIAQSAFDPLK
ncbi:hypothetical protein AAF712_008336 [Marasmius tenuissimus]|uniref:Uncharacterized protein n=1 Tax=Marasmius tenuissimus TaxID=585030 RepID=A0ABR2ZV25_9AGAR